MPDARDARLVASLAREVVCDAFAITHAELVDRRRRDRDSTTARQIAMYIAHVVGQLTLKEVAKEFRRSRTTASHGCTLVEDRRDSPIFDMELEYLERRFRERLQWVVDNSSGVGDFANALDH